MNKNMAKSIQILLITIMLFSGGALSLQAQSQQLPAPSGGGSTLPSSGGGSTVTKPTPVTKLDNPISANNIKELLLQVVDLAINIGLVVSVLMFVWVGFKFIWAQGNQSELSDAKEWFFYVVIGTALLISSKVIVEVLSTTLVNTGIVNEQLFK